MTHQDGDNGFLAELAREAGEVIAVWAVVWVLAAAGLAIFVWFVAGPLP